MDVKNVQRSENFCIYVHILVLMARSCVASCSPDGNIHDLGSKWIRGWRWRGVVAMNDQSRYWGRHFSVADWNYNKLRAASLWWSRLYLGEYVLLANANINEAKCIEANYLPVSTSTTLPESITARRNMILPKAILIVSSGKSAQSSSAVSEWALVTCEADCSPS